jgi:hypothetical protein
MLIELVQKQGDRPGQDPDPARPLRLGHRGLPVLRPAQAGLAQGGVEVPGGRLALPRFEMEVKQVATSPTPCPPPVKGGGTRFASASNL